MEVLSSRVETSPDKGRVRLVAEVRYDGAGLGTEIYWHEVPEKLAGSLTSTGNPWLACLVPLAVTMGERLRIAPPVDPVLYENVHQLMQIWKVWYPKLTVVPIEADVEMPPPRTTPGRTAGFFSGGVDSFFTAIQTRKLSDGRIQFPVDDLINVAGLDIAKSQKAAYTRMWDMLQKASDELGKEFVPALTNVRETRLDTAEWGYLYHPGAISSVALAMEDRYSAALIASSFGYYDLTAWGSHPLTDPLYTTSRTRIVHDGASFDKLTKILAVAKSPVVMKYLHVCATVGTDENCGNCHKCYRTMATLEVAGALKDCATFQGKPFIVERLRKIYSHDARDRAGVRQLSRYAREKGRPDIADALARSLKYSDRFDRWKKVAARLKPIPGVRRVANRTTTILKRGWLP
jgi:hypothetical protein